MHRIKREIRHAFWGLVRCPLCRERPTGSAGCCEVCREGLLAPRASDNQIVLGSYGGRLERAVRAYKFGHATRLTHLFGPALAQRVRQQGWAVDTVCAVPLHWRRRWQRGYNQSALLARAVARDLGLPYKPLLTRTRATEQQARLGRAERLRNVQSAFVAQPTKGRVLLIDDVITSGATTNECARVLKEAGASEVRLAAIAGPKQQPSNGNSVR